MNRSTAALLTALLALVFACAADAQQARRYRVAMIRTGGADVATTDGLKEGLKQLGFVDGVHYTLETLNLEGDRAAIAAAAERLERDKVDLLCPVSTSVTIAVKRAPTKTPIVFAVGSDPVANGLIDTFPKPGGRLTGVYYSTTDVTAKRLAILKEMLPALRKVVTFYDPGNQAAVDALRAVRGAARQLHVEVVALPVRSVEDLRAQLSAFKPADADAYFYVNDAMVRSQAQFIVDTMKAKKVPTMFSFPGIAAQGALAGYGVSFREVGRVSARYVQKVLTGTSPRELPVESVSRVELAVNVRTAREIGVTIPQAVRLSASEVFE